MSIIFGGSSSFVLKTTKLWRNLWVFTQSTNACSSFFACLVLKSVNISRENHFPLQLSSTGQKCRTISLFDWKQVYVIEGKLHIYILTCKKKIGRLLTCLWTAGKIYMRMYVFESSLWGTCRRCLERGPNSNHIEIWYFNNILQCLSAF